MKWNLYLRVTSWLNFLRLLALGAVLDWSGPMADAQTTLAAGDVAITAINSANPDQFTFVLLKAITAGTVINFTDNGFSSATAGRTGEGFLTFTADQDYPAGRVFGWTNGVTVGTYWSGNNPANLAFNGSGDQLFIFQGATASWGSQSGITLLYGINYGATVLTTGTAAASSTYQPAALSAGAFLNLPASTANNGYFSGTGSSATTVALSGTASAIFSDLLNSSKWLMQSTAATFPALSLTLSAATTTTLTASVNPSTFSQAITFTASLRTNAVIAANATSNFLFKVDGVAVATNAIASGQATYTTSGLSVGTHIITAEYPGTPSYLPSTNQLTQTVNQAAVNLALTSSLNPAGYLSSVNVTASVPVTVTGNLQFSTNGTVFSTVSLIGGVASSALNTLPRGTNLITVSYAGDANYLGSTNTLSQIITNHPPVAANASFSRNAGISSLHLAISDLLAGVTDADGDSIVLVSASVSTNGITLVNGSGYLSYQNTNAVNDEFTYTVTDGFGGTSTAKVSLTVNNAFIGGQSQGIALVNNIATLNFAGIPQYPYAVQRSTNLITWTDVWLTNAPANGAFQFVDDLSANPPASAYYRLRYNP